LEVYMPSNHGPRLASRAGQALIEYVLMLSFIAVGLGGILAVLRDTAGSVYNNASSQVAIVCPYGVTNGGSGQNSNGSGGNCNGSGGAGGLINGVAGGGGVGGGSAGNPIGGTKGGGKP
jgi:Flp pilus assembly pilin Flp